MNRIVIIGNGFDKAHDLPTGYNDFFEYYWRCRIDALVQKNSITDDDGLCSFTRIRRALNWDAVVDAYRKSDNLTKFLKIIDSGMYGYAFQMSPFLKAIKKEYEHKGWMDIENQYYKLLTDIVDGKYIAEYPDVKELNGQLKCLKDNLVAYLLDIQNERLKENLIIPRIKQIIYEPFRAKDIAISGRKKFNEFLEYMWNKDILDIQDWKQGLDRRTITRKFEIQYRFEDLYDYYENILYYAERRGIDAAKIHIDNIYEYKTSAWYNRNSLDYFLYPENIMLLTFNYTNSVDLYKPENSSNVEVNHIHGELTTPDNIIFGYGDDMDEDYARIEKLNDNAYLDNIKAFYYNDSVNYRRMLEFIESAPYQIYIMGHSCGTSDRTLINTLFEHDNCISIKPYFYQKSQTEDNYLELVQNISRNFKSRPKMRDRVVNKTFCEPLIKLEPEI